MGSEMCIRDSIYTPPPPQMGYARSLSPPLAPPPPKKLHSAADVPKKVEKTSSDNTTFENSEHPYRTCGSPGGFCSPWIFQIPIKNLSFRCGLSPKSRKNVKRKHVVHKFAFGCGRPQKSRKNFKRKHHFCKFGAPLLHLRLFRLIFLYFRFLPYVSFPLKNQ